MGILMFTIEWIKERILTEQYYFTRHGDQERKHDNLTICEVEQALIN
jgi:hypothetical protein